MSEIILNVCQDCGNKSGSKPKPYPVGVWIGVCCGCGHMTGCSALRDWTPHITSFDPKTNLAKGKK